MSSGSKEAGFKIVEGMGIIGENGRIIGDIEKRDRTENVGENGELSERKENFWSPM